MLCYQDTVRLHYQSFLEKSESLSVLQIAIWQSENLSCCGRKNGINKSHSSGKEDEVIMKKISIYQMRASEKQCAKVSTLVIFD